MMAKPYTSTVGTFTRRLTTPSKAFAPGPSQHLVHRDARGNPAAVLGILIDPGYASNDARASLPAMIGFTDTKNADSDEPEHQAAAESGRQLRGVLDVPR